MQKKDNVSQSFNLRIEEVSRSDEYELDADDVATNEATKPRAKLVCQRAELDAKWKPFFLDYMSCCGGGACVPRDPALPISVLETHLR